MGHQTIRQQISSKLQIVRPDTVIGVSGPIGTAQRYCGEVQRLAAFRRNEPPDLVMQKIRNVFVPIIKEEFEMARAAVPLVGNQVAGSTALASAVVATTTGNDVHHLFQYNHQGSPEAASRDLPFVAIGSGQLTADPFLAFIRRLFWSDRLPSVADGIFAAVWTVRHAIHTSPGGVADPIQAIVLHQGKARQLDAGELDETERAIASAERRCAMHAMPSMEKGAVPDSPTPPPPSPSGS